MMIFINGIFKEEHLYTALWEPFVLLLAPYAPHLGEELWEKLGHTETLAYTAWPSWDENLVKEDTAEIVVQINGKVRTKLHLPAGTAKEELEKTAFAQERIQSLLEGKTVVKTIVVPDKLVNIVAR